MDAKTGAVLWETQIDDIKKGLQRTVAPLVVKNKVILGVAGAEYGIRGFIDDLRCRYGKRAEVLDGRGPDDPGGQQLGRRFLARGAGRLGYGTYDPESNLNLLGTGNPGPDWKRRSASGTTYIRPRWSALDVDTGK